MRSLIRDEPVLLANLFKAVLICAVAFGLPLTGDQTTALVGVAAATLAIGGVVRSAVAPVAKVERLADEIGGNATKLVTALKGGGDAAA